MSKLGVVKQRPKIDFRFTKVDEGMKVAALVYGKEYVSETVPFTSRFQAQRRVRIAAQDKLRGEGLW